jgi:phosphatidylinositol glycan class N
MIMTSFLWVQIISEYQFIKALWKHLFERRMNHVIKLLATAAVSIFIAEFLVCIFSIILSSLAVELFRITACFHNGEVQIHTHTHTH